MASTLAARRPSAFPANPASHPADEEFINRSLLDSLNDQANTEPMSSSDSEAPSATGHVVGPIAVAASIGSPSVPYHISMQQAQQQSQQASRPVSPSSNNILPSYLTSPPLSADPFTSNTAPSQQLYNSMTNIHSLPPDFQSVSSPEHDALNSQTSHNGFPSGPLRSSVPFNAFNHRARQTTTSLRDTSSSFAAASYPNQEIYLQNSITPTQQPPPNSFEPIHHPGRYDYGIGASQSVPSVQPKQAGFSAMDALRLGLEPASSQLKAAPPGFLRDAQTALAGQHQTSAQSTYQAPHPNGLSHPLSHQNPLQPQGPFGSHPAINVGGPAGAQGSSLVGTTATVQGSQQQPQEEISTIFVVGFPDDMSVCHVVGLRCYQTLISFYQEREFQNMFTFSAGFEAATLKIPNRELTSYGSLTNSQNGRTGSVPMHYVGSNDPYNLVTVNQGGVVVDGRDGITSSWPAAPTPFGDENHFVPTNVPAQPPRKQIIGFAKFRTRQEALEARDVLQGRRVDLEKGSVLKAEMAKKNLHTKRGPGASVPPVTSLLNGPSAMQPEGVNSTLTGLLGSNGLNGEVFSQREKEQLERLGAMGIAGLGQRRGTIVDERTDIGPIGLSNFGPRGARERAEEDERERERKRKEKEAVRLRQNTYAFEAFHSVPSQMVRQGANSLLSAESGIVNGTNGHSLSTQSSMQSLSSQDGISSSISPWGSLRDIGASAAQRKMTISSHAPQRPTSADQQNSPTQLDGAPSPPSGAASASGSTNPSAPFSPDSTSSSLPGQPSFQPFGHRPGSPGSDNLPYSGTSSANGASNLNGDDLARAVGALAVSTQQPSQQGNTSPQLPSPSSGTSSSTGRNPGDHNPPVSTWSFSSEVWDIDNCVQINTLYVGNLPSTTSPGGSSAKLEERLRELFTRQPGYRQLCFRHKSNGPMCFVEVCGRAPCYVTAYSRAFSSRMCRMPPEL